ncbi:MAG TPA: glycosyltransferase family 2 protein, partial [Nitrospinota bacterium]|nr:glycosyltransferase family 2 protein [Nitrospinota bacterium]
KQKGYNTVIQMDADGQHDPAYLLEMLKEIQNTDVDVVIGSRFLEDNAYKTTISKRLGMVLFGLLTSLITKMRITDPTSGFQVLKGDVIDFMSQDLYPPDYPDADMIILLNRAGFKIKEVPVKMRSNPKHAKSMHRGHKTIYYVLKMLLSIIVTVLRVTPKRRNSNAA